MSQWTAGACTRTGPIYYNAARNREKMKHCVPLGGCTKCNGAVLKVGNFEECINCGRMYKRNSYGELVVIGR